MTKNIINIIEIVSSEFILTNWEQINSIISENFTNAEFCDNFTMNRPAEHTFLGVTGKLNREFIHLLAIENNEIIGALFCIPSNRLNSEIECDLGWFFTSYSLPNIKKVKIGDAIMNKAHQMLKDEGFQIVVTEMGTKAGETFMNKRYGYIYSPIENKSNRWIKSL